MKKYQKFLIVALIILAILMFAPVLLYLVYS
ncbi:hypothetical protein Q783_06075 [Carnobacterium inhibens subsp. gilichinskyi]|uniref:Uncharacterized protein n=1 Tax=Carnobacterium inhibens subsp. gilichinskyi TaxID=1266845 RepID=U5SFD3_9LACT|nr:hypothetical protein Q783_06075 [Carnobacterium inhibens subsp. gilichinskyi]